MKSRITHTIKKIKTSFQRKKIWITLLACTSPVFAQQNVLLIIADDYGAESSSLYTNAETAPTPTIEALGNNGVIFNQAWAQPSCAPTRATILTGRYGFRTGVGIPGDTIPQNEFTMAQGLKAAGYSTACIGKWHLSGAANGGDDNPNIMGFDHYEGPIEGGINNYRNWTKVTNGVRSNVRTYATTEQVNNARDWIAGQGDNPWFCQLALNAPHDPFHLPPNNLHSFNDLSGTNQDIAANPVPYFYAMVEAMDTEIGRLLAQIDPDVLANTNIIFVGDNGTTRQVDQGSNRDDKGSLYEGGVHVPFLVSGPAVDSPGRRVDANIHTVDLFETVLDIAGVHSDDLAPEGTIIDSVSFRQYLTNPDQENFHSYNFADTFRTPSRPTDGVAITDGNFKLIRFSNGNEELYQISVDPEEARNLNRMNINNANLAALTELQSILDALENGERVDRGINEPQEVEPVAFIPDPNVYYHIENPTHGLRIAANGNSEDPYTTSLDDNSADTLWRFVPNENGFWHIDRAEGGTVPRLRIDNTSTPDMHATTSAGVWTYYSITSSVSNDGTYYLTLPDGPENHQRLGVLSNGSMDFRGIASQGVNVSLRIVEANTDFTPDPNRIYHIENPTWGLRLAANGSNEIPGTVPSTSSGVNTRWSFVPSPNAGLWHIQRAAGGDVPRLRSLLSSVPDMQSTGSSGNLTQFEIAPNPSREGTYLLTVPNANTDLQRLRILSNGSVDFATNNNMGNNPSLIFIEAE